jgi:hypothetical protein
MMPDGLPEWTLTVASLLGWSEPGFVIIAATVIVGFLFLQLVVWLMVGLPDALANKANGAKGSAAGVFWGLMLIVAALIAIFLNFVLMIVFLLAILGLAGSVREYWWKGK